MEGNMISIKNYTILNLREIAKSNNYRGYSKMNKQDLYDFLKEKDSKQLIPKVGIPKPIVRGKLWEFVQLDRNYAEFMTYDRFDPNYKFLEGAFDKAYTTYRISGIYGASLEVYLENAKTSFYKLVKPETYKVQLKLVTEWFDFAMCET